ncbi:MAG: Asp23/Gls24 family envelope stress response protein [Myxococcota bacterium]|jgi:uncharacterized alkaline shock family protein YloU|nr:Asp23/Gls24 family envelope stress response protein [Myxococcota bacterium]MEC9443085.1 Asp23/Gls24 family envelope stress response protein [Myxococcota bacterium]
MATATKNKTNEELTSRQTEGTDLVLLGESGKTKIASDVVAKIAGLAIREVEGVHALVPFGAGQTLSSVAQSLGVSERKDMGVHVEVGSVEAAVDMRIITEFGAPIPHIAEQIRERVSAQILSMTGLRVKEVNIDVVDLFFASDQQPEPIPTPDTRVR